MEVKSITDDDFMLMVMFQKTTSKVKITEKYDGVDSLKY